MVDIQSAGDDAEDGLKPDDARAVVLPGLRQGFVFVDAVTLLVAGDDDGRVHPCGIVDDVLLGDDFESFDGIHGRETRFGRGGAQLVEELHVEWVVGGSHLLGQFDFSKLSEQMRSFDGRSRGSL